MIIFLSRKTLVFFHSRLRKHWSLSRWIGAIILLSSLVSFSCGRSFPHSFTYSAVKSTIAEIQLQEVKELLIKAETILNETEVPAGKNIFDNVVFEPKYHEAKRNNYEDPITGYRRGAYGKEHICDLVCGHCMEVASRRVASLCSHECLWEGHHFKACMTYYSLRSKK